MQRKDSGEFGWIVVTRGEYDKLRAHEYAGPGTPLNPSGPGHWMMVNENGSTVLYTGVEIDEDGSVLCPDCELGRIAKHDRCDNCGLSYEDLEAAASFLQ